MQILTIDVKNRKNRIIKIKAKTSVKTFTVESTGIGNLEDFERAWAGCIPFAQALLELDMKITLTALKFHEQPKTGRKGISFKATYYSSALGGLVNIKSPKYFFDKKDIELHFVKVAEMAVPIIEELTAEGK